MITVDLQRSLPIISKCETKNVIEPVPTAYTETGTKNIENKESSYTTEETSSQVAMTKLNSKVANLAHYHSHQT